MSRWTGEPAATQPAELTLFVDGECPLCRREAAMLRRAPAASRVEIVDLSAPDFDASHFGLDGSAVRRRLHALRADGSLVRDFEASREAARAVGLARIVRVTSLPGLRQLLDWSYPLFALLRGPLGRLLRALGWRGPALDPTSGD